MLTAVIVAAGALPAVGEYTPVEFAASLVSGVAEILPWIGAGVAGGIGLMFIFMGIRKGIAFFKGTAK